MCPMTDYTKARDYMIKGQLLPCGVANRAVINSFSNLPREMFVPEKIQQIAYTDKNISLGQGRYLLSPLMHARLLQEASPRIDDVVLDVGSASGYGSAILSPLVTMIIALENNKRQMDKASRLWKKLELCNIALIENLDITKGYAKQAPYSLIIIGAGVAAVPECLLDQLAPEGRLVCFIREKNAHMGYGALYYRAKNGSVSSKRLFDAAIPYLEEFYPGSVFNF